MFFGIDAHGHIAAFEEPPTAAAHSMDTDWYAVDRDGHVAKLWSAEEGSVPWQAHRQYWSELYEDLAVARTEALVPAAAGDRHVFELSGELRTIPPAGLPYEWSGTLRFANREYLEMFRYEHYDPDWRKLDFLPDAAAVKHVTRTAFLDYWDAGAIVRAYYSAGSVQPRTLGLFEYECSFMGPYNRTAIPGRPMRLDELPPPLRGRIGALQISRLSFYSVARFDPESLVPCHKYR